MKQLLMIVAALAVTTLFAQANETVKAESVTADTVKQATEAAPSQKNGDTATHNDADQKADEKTTEKH